MVNICKSLHTASLSVISVKFNIRANSRTVPVSLLSKSMPPPFLRTSTISVPMNNILRMILDDLHQQNEWKWARSDF